MTPAQVEGNLAATLKEEEVKNAVTAVLNRMR
jgi:hypothetical protein